MQFDKLSKGLRTFTVLAATLLVSPMPANAKAASAKAALGHEVVSIWPGPAPGTEEWKGAEIALNAELPGAGKVHIKTNVTVPTLTVIRPTLRKPNGTAMVVAPGGSFRALAWDLEGMEIGEWLSRQGITAFVLKYRVRSPENQSSGKAESFDNWAARIKDARSLALADAEQAIRFIRANNTKYGLAANRVGMIGFSAGAMTTMGAVLSKDVTARPDFAAPIYGANVTNQAPDGQSPALFIVAAQDDQQVPAAKSVEVYQQWSQARAPAELHLYEKGGHGFGMRLRNLPADKWPAALEIWLRSRGLVAAASSLPSKPKISK